MKHFVYKSWNGVMNANHNPLRHIPDENVRHWIMQILAWMWCVMFSLWMGSMWVFGISAVAHVFIPAAIVITVTTFETAKRRPKVFLKKGNWGWQNLLAAVNFIVKATDNFSFKDGL